MKRLAGYILLLITVTSTYYFLSRQENPPETVFDLSTPSPLLGQTVANALHQAMSDPYLVPLERAAEYLNNNPEASSIELASLVDWAVDAEFPTFFTYDFHSRKFSFDKTTSPWAIDAIKSELYRKVFTTGNAQEFIIKIVEIEGQRWWVGAINIPIKPHSGSEIIGAFFNIENYLKEDIPRFIDKVVLRKRFPLVPFQKSSLNIGMADGHIAIRILDEQKRTYFQRGHNFESAFLIYAESQWYDNTVVCLNKGWDLQVFSSVPMTKEEKKRFTDQNHNLILLIMMGLISIIYWWSTAGMRKIRHSNENG